MDFLNRKAPSNDYKGEAQAAHSSLESDFDLLQQVAQGDHNAFALLYEHHSPRIFTYLVHLVQDESVAEDLIQEVFVALWTGAHRFRGESMVKTWLYQIAHHKAVSWLRRNVSKSGFEISELLSKTDTPEDQAEDSWRNEQVREAVTQLSVDHKAVIELAFYHELTYTEIAQILRCPLGTVKSRMSYARKYLLTVLKTKDIR